MNKINQVITHSGKFHTDEVVACAAIRLSCGEEISIVRTREVQQYLDDPNVAVVDVGGKYTPNISNFDHHQPGGPIRASGIPYSAAGLIWAEYGMSVCQDPTVWEMVDRNIAIIDASDNGVGAPPDHDRISLQEIISAFNPSWLESPGDSDAAFGSAVTIATQVLSRWIAQAHASAQAANLVEMACTKDSQILRLPKAVPWHTTFFSGAERSHQFVIFQAGPSDWRLQCIPPTMMESFKQRTPLPAGWAGLRDIALEAESGVVGAVFCHKGRFIAGGSSEAAVEALARLALAQ